MKLTLNLKKYLTREITLFIIIGIFSTLVHLLVLMLMVEYLKLTPMMGNFIAFFVSLLSSYALNHKHTFQSTKKWHETFFKYLFTVLWGLALNQGVIYTGVHILQVSYIISFAFVVIIVPASNFIIHKYWTFK